MTKTIGEVIFDLAKKAGIKEDHEALVALAQDKPLFEKPFDEALETAINASLISLKDAKNNHPEIRAHYNYQSLLPIDKIIEKALDEYGITDTQKADILAETSTYKRVPLIIAAIKDTEGKKSLTDKEAKAEFQKTIDKLHSELRNEKADRTKDKESYDTREKDIRRTSQTERMLIGYPTIYDDLDPELRLMNMMNAINKELQDNQAELVFDDAGAFVLRMKKDGSTYYGKDNQPINPKGFIEQTLSKNKILKVPKAAPAGGNNGTGNTQPTGGAGGDGKNKVSPAFKDLIDKATQDYNANANGVGQPGVPAR